MMHLALSLGKTLDEIKNISNDELNHWIAFSKLFPLPNSWEQTALQCATNVKIHCGKDIDLNDFMPVEKVEVEQSIEEKKAIIARFMRRLTK